MDAGAVMLVLAAVVVIGYTDETTTGVLGADTTAATDGGEFSNVLTEYGEGSVHNDGRMVLGGELGGVSVGMGETQVGSRHLWLTAAAA